MKAEHFESVELSDLGRKRKNNEDACLRIPESGIYCVADGMGGQAGGDLASAAIIAALQEVFGKAEATDLDTLSGRIGFFRRAANQASKWIKNFSDEKMIGQMGSTIVGLVLDPKNPARGVGLHAGDSRLYRFRKGELKLLTGDHSAVAVLAAKLGRDPASIPAKYQNELLRCVGLYETVELEKTAVEVASDDVFLICSDGLTRMMPDDAIVKVLERLAQEPISTVARMLIDGANEAGGSDNITVILLKAGDIVATPDGAGPEEENEAEAPSGGAAPPDTGKPDTAHTYQGDTPKTDDLNADRTPNTRELGGGSDQKNKVLDPKEPDVRPGRSFGATIVFVLAAVALIGAGVWFAADSKRSAAKAAIVHPSASASPSTNALVPKLKSQTEDVQKGEAAKYQAALAAGQKACSQGDFATAIQQAQAVLADHPQDVVALALKRDAQAGQKEQGAKYQAALAAGQAALGQRDYAAAIQQAEAALARQPQDAAALKLKSDAKAAQEQARAGYQLELTAGQEAFAQKQYPAAVRHAEAALARQPQDVVALRLKSDAESAQEGENAKYRGALAAGQKAYVAKDYGTAIQQAEAALAHRVQDAAALKLKGDSEARQKEEAGRFQSLLAAGQEAYARQDYAAAVRQAEEALAHQPKDAAALKLLESARQFEAADAASQKFQSGLRDGQKAIKSGDYTLALAKAKEALTVRPKDPAASELMSQAQGFVDLANARDLFAQGSYDGVAKLCQTYPVNEAFSRLARSNHVEQTALMDARTLFNNGDYSFTVRLKRQSYGNKAPFVSLLKEGKREWETLGYLEALEQTNNWRAVLAKLNDPAYAGLTNKTPFRELATRALNQKEHARLDAVFETMLVWFNIKSPTDSYIQTMEARNARKIVGKMDETLRANYLQSLNQMESGYKQGGWLEERDHVKYIKKLRDSITHYQQG